MELDIGGGEGFSHDIDGPARLAVAFDGLAQAFDGLVEVGVGPAGGAVDGEDAVVVGDEGEGETEGAAEDDDPVLTFDVLRDGEDLGTIRVFGGIESADDGLGVGVDLDTEGDDEKYGEDLVEPSGSAAFAPGERDKKAQRQHGDDPEFDVEGLPPTEEDPVHEDVDKKGDGGASAGAFSSDGDEAGKGDEQGDAAHGAGDERLFESGGALGELLEGEDAVGFVSGGPVPGPLDECDRAVGFGQEDADDEIEAASDEGGERGGDGETPPSFLSFEQETEYEQGGAEQDVGVVAEEGESPADAGKSIGSSPAGQT